MINISVFSSDVVSIENTDYIIDSKEDMVKFLKALMDKVWYGGERVCLQSVEQNTAEGKNYYTEIDRWEGYPNRF